MHSHDNQNIRKALESLDVEKVSKKEAFLVFISLTFTLFFLKNYAFSREKIFSNFLQNFWMREVNLKYDSEKFKLAFPLSNGEKFGFITFLVFSDFMLKDVFEQCLNDGRVRFLRKSFSGRKCRKYAGNRRFCRFSSDFFLIFRCISTKKHY